MRWLAYVLGAIVLLGAGAHLLDVGHECGRHRSFTTISPFRGFCRSGPMPARLALKELALAQADFRGNDRDGDGDKNFWRADIAGLYALAPGGGPAIKLAPLWLAAADDRAVVDLSAYAVPSAHGGYWYRAIRHPDENPQALGRYRFAFCAFPDSASAGKYIYICDENLTIHRSAANGRRGIDVFPADEELKTQWSQVD